MKKDDMEIVNITRKFVLENFDSLKECSQDLEWDDWEKKNFLYDLNQKFQLSFGVSIYNFIVGYSILSLKDSKNIHLHRFITSSKYRGKGVGSFMWDEIIKRFKNHKAIGLTLKVHQKNIKSIKFYENRHMKKSELHDGYHLMELNRDYSG